MKKHYKETKTKDYLIIEWNHIAEDVFMDVFIEENADREEVIKQLRKRHIYVKSCYYPIYVNDGYMYIGTEDDNHIWFSKSNKRPLKEGLKDIDCNIHKVLNDFYYSI